MAVITYTAKRKLISGHAAGQRYTFDVGLEDWTPNPETPGSSSTSLSGRNFETLHRIEDAWQARTLAYDDPSVIAQMDEFLASVAAGEQFEIDPFGTIASPDNSILCKLRGNSKWSKDIANTAGPYYRYSFKAWKAQGLSSAIIDILNTADFARASDGWAYGSDQLLDEYAADELRRDHDPVTGAFRGVLVEETGTATNSDSIDISSSSSWGGDSFYDVTQTTSVIEGQPAWRHENLGGVVNTNRGKVRGPLSSSKQSLFALIERVNTDDVSLGFRDNDGSGWLFRINFDLQAESYTITDSGAGQDVAVSIEQLSSSGPNGGSLWRLSGSAVPANPGNEASMFLYPTGRSRNTNTTIVHAIQHVESGTISSLIADNADGATRAADVLEGAFSESSGTLHFVGEHKGGDGVLWQADDGTEDNRLRLYIATGDVLFDITVGGIVQDQFNLGALASDGTYDVAIRFAQEDFAACMNGGSVISSTDDDMPAVDTFRFGRDTSATEGINWYKRGDLRRALLTDEQIQELTG